MNKFMASVAVTLLVALFLFSYGIFWMVEQFKAPGPLMYEKIVEIPAGSTVSSIAQKLEQEKVIQSDLLFRIAAKYRGIEDQLQAGEYNFPARISTSGVLEYLVDGMTHQRQITVVEGLTSQDIVNILNGAEGLSGNLTTPPPEGTLLPETYNFTLNMPRERMIERMHEAMTSTLAELWPNRDPDLPIITMQEAVTLASIIEKETAIDEERARVAGVFINRLERGIPLQSDPTVIYALTEGSGQLDRPLYRNDLKTDHPYNTYVVRGLPPGPICNPGRASLIAALHPEDHDYLYFVANGDGGHAFATTLKEHNRNVAKWRKIKKEAAAEAAESAKEAEPEENATGSQMESPENSTPENSTGVTAEETTKENIKENIGKNIVTGDEDAPAMPDAPVAPVESGAVTPSEPEDS